MKSLLIFIFFCLGLLYAQTPDWAWAVSASGPSTDRVNAMCTDSNGNVYITGTYTYSCQFGDIALTSNISAPTIFVAKTDSEGNWLWAFTPSSVTSISQSYAIAIDSEENIYIAGYFSGIMVLGEFTLYDTASSDIFVLKLDSLGEVMWAVRGGSYEFEAAYAIAVDETGNILISGDFNDATQIGDTYLQSPNTLNIFVAKLNAAGNWLWARQATSSIGIQCATISSSPAGDAYISGRFSGSGSFGSFITSNYNGYRTFVAKLDTNGNWQYISDIISQNSINAGTSLKADQYGNCYVCGTFNMGIIIGPNALNSAGSSDIYVAKLDPYGQWLWGTRAGGTNVDGAYGLAIQDQNEVVLAGNFSGIASFGSIDLSTNGTTGVFTARVSAEGTWLWAKQAVATSNVNCNTIALSPSSEILIAGSYSGSMLFGNIELPLASMWDIFIAKLQAASPNQDEVISSGDGLIVSPNPFSERTTITLPDTRIAKQTEISIFNIKGQKIKTFRPGSNKSIFWDGTDSSGKICPNGIYIIQDTENHSKVGRMVKI